jgi:hypothetical protein
MEVLEHRKHEAILFTFKQVKSKALINLRVEISSHVLNFHFLSFMHDKVSFNFAAVFKELVPHGKANLVMKTEGPPIPVSIPFNKDRMI